MEVKQTIYYDIDKSSERIDEILNSSNTNYSDSDKVPKRDDLTYTNGRYVYVTALFIDIVGSSDMTDEYRRPTLAKIYRSFISECVALMNSSDICKEININGDCVWGVFETPYKSDIDDVFSLAARLNSLIKILNYKYEKKGYDRISVGIGIDYGRALMVKAGYSGSGLNDVIWMGDVVNQACHLSNRANRNGRKVILMGSVLHQNLCTENQDFCNKYYDAADNKYNYEAGVINTAMDNWYKEHCK